MPPIFAAVDVPAVQAVLKTGAGPLRFYSFGLAPQDVALPYAVWQNVFGSPENYFGNRPDVDSCGVQVDVYGETASSVLTVAEKLRGALEGVCYITAWRGTSIDPDTSNYRLTFECQWFVDR